MKHFIGGFAVGLFFATSFTKACCNVKEWPDIFIMIISEVIWGCIFGLAAWGLLP